MPISVGSVEVDVIPSTRGIYQRLRDGIVPAATRAGEDAGSAAGRAFGPAMQGQVGGIGLSIGEQIGQQIASRITAALRNAVRDGITQGGRQGLPAATRQGDETGGAFSRALKIRLEAAFRSLPKIQIDANTSEADADLQALRVRMESLANKRIGIDIDAEVAKAEIRLIEAELTRLGAEHPNVQVRADTATALGELAAVRAAIDGVDGQTARVNVDTSGALSAVFQLSVAIAGLAAIPAIPILAAGIGSIAAAGVAAGAGVGALAAVAIPAFKGIAGALQAQKSAQDAVSTATIKGGQASSQGSSKALQLAGAQQTLATAERNGARQIAQAQQQVQQAKTAAADAIVQAGQRNAQAARQVQDAEKALAQSQKDARQAQADLTAARKQAGQELEDLANRYVDAQLSQRDAALGVQEAQQRLAQVNAAGSKATALERQQAQLAYDQAVQRLREQTTDTKRLKDQQAEAAKTGVKGTDTYKQAQDRLAKAQQNVADKAQAVGDAQTSAAQTQVQTARQVAEAQQRVSEATANVAVAQQSAADAVSSAQRQIASASQSAAGGVDQAAVAQAKYQAELAKLTPAARGTFNAFLSLKTAFTDWSKALQPAVMPLFTRALNGIKNALPGLTPLVLAAARGISILQDRISAGFKSAAWKSLKADIASSALPAIVGLGTAFLNIFKGMGGIIDAFLPHMGGISSAMQRMTGRFANWGASLKGSPAFEHFLAYAAQQAPILAHALGQAFTALFQVSKALAPLSGPALAVLTGLATGVGWLAVHMPGLVQLMYAMYVATRLATLATVAFNVALVVFRAGVVLAILLTQGWTAAIVAANVAFELNPAVAIVTIIIAALVLLVAGILYAWNHWSWFRTVVIAVWDAIKVAALFVWNSVLKPTFDAIWAALQLVGRVALWLWQSALSPVFGFIGAAAKILMTTVVVIAILPIIVAFKLLAAIGRWLWASALKPAFDSIAAGATWLWKNVLSPTFGLIGAAAKWLWNNAVKPAFNSIKLGMVQFGDQAKWLWKNVISPVFGWIGDRAKWLWSNALRPQFDLIKAGVRLVGDAFKSVVGAIKTQWDKLEGIAKRPVAFIVNTVYSKGLRPTWNAVASAFGAPQLPAAKGFAQGGVLPGYTPGKDVHKFYSPTGGGLELSGGESIMRPEWTRAVGSQFVNAMNRIASSRGATGVKAALAPALGGNPNTPTDRSLKYKDGGIFGWIKSAGSAVAGAGSAAWNGIKKGASWLTDTLEGSARAGVKAAVNPLLANFPGMDSGFGKMLRKVPDKMIDSLFGYSKEADKRGAGGIGGPKIQAALNWVKTQNGLPYQWGGNGSPSWDCCIIGTVRIYGPNGATPIQDVRAGDKVYSYADGKLTTQTVTAAWKSKTQQVFKVRTRNRAVTASANHPFMRLVMVESSRHVKGGKRGEQTPARYDIEWARLDELRRGDLLVQPSEMDVQPVTAPTLPDGTPVTADIAWLLGLFIGDGYVTDNNIRICVYDDNSVRAQQIFRSIGVNSFTSPKHGVVASSVAVVKTLRDMGMDVPGPKKRVPTATWTWDRELRQAFLDGYCAADGHRPADQARHGERTYSSASRELVEDVRALHLMLGQHPSNISTNNRTKPIVIKGVPVKDAKPLHTFAVWRGKRDGEVALRRHSAGIAAWLDAGDFTISKVLGVSDEGEQDTYDLEIAEAHNFIADGIVVHNSGLMSAIESVIRGQKPHRRWATGAFSGKTAPPGWVLNGNSPFRIGITNAGVGHTAGTLGKTNVESSGGAGVHMGASARGWNDPMFTSHYGFMPGKFDSGGYLQPGMNLAYNGTGRPEPVFTTAQANALTQQASAPAGGVFEGDLVLDSGEFLGRVRGEVHQQMAGLTTVLRAGRTG